MEERKRMSANGIAHKESYPWMSVMDRKSGMTIDTLIDEKNALRDERRCMSTPVLKRLLGRQATFKRIKTKSVTN